MPGILDLRRRIRSVKNTQQITRAMKMVAAARLRRAQDRVLNSRPYVQQIFSLLERVAARTEDRSHPLLAERPVQKVLLVLVTADRGLCGAFNSNLIRAAQGYFNEHGTTRVQLMAIGRKGRDYFRKRRVTIAGEHVQLFGHLEYAQARDIAAEITKLYAYESVDAVDFIYNEFKSVMTQRLVVERCLPIKPAAASTTGDASTRTSGGATQATGETMIDYIYEQPSEEIFAALLPRYLESQVYRALVESEAAELAAKMTAMDTATNNAADMIDSLTLHMNRVRQAAITKEIIEIVGGAAAQGG